MSYPKTVIACITAHGGIDVDRNGELTEEYIVPDGVRIIKLSAVSPGVCNLVFEGETGVFVDAIFEFIAGRKRFTQRTVEKLAERLHELDEETKNVEGTRIQGLESRAEGAPDLLTEEYFHHADKKYTVRTYLPGEEIINKVYVRDNREFSESPFDLKINLMNVRGVPDLVEIISGKKTGLRSRGEDDSSEIHLNQGIDYLVGKKVTTIVLVDLSCSFFGVQGADFTKPSASTSEARPRKSKTGKKTPSPEESSDSELDPRSTRRARAALKKMGQNGGKKRRNRKTKTKKRKLIL
jgi:hypothetical protein